MIEIQKIKITNGVYWISIPEADLRLLCGCPADTVKHLKKLGLINASVKIGVEYETGPNAILLSDLLVQNGHFSNLAEFPVLQMLYNQGMGIPGHPNNTGEKPILIGSKEQVVSQLEYLMRGNYGLLSKDELLESGISEQMAEEIMVLKLKFAFGQIKDSEEFIETRPLEGEWVEIKNEVKIRRLHTNIFEIQYKRNFVSVDLNLNHYEEYKVPYVLGYHRTGREYFSVIHSGEGNGWDVNRPSMASIIQFQGEIYLIDAGPNIGYILMSLGISINEIEGVFHTHAHDDHFAGLPALMKSDHKIKYYSTPLVRLSVLKKLAALISFDEKDFNDYFDIHDLQFDKWNNVNGLEVKPVFSPHPVETNAYYFRAMGRNGYKTYAHLADIVALDVLKKLATGTDKEKDIINGLYEKISTTYFIPVDLKKIDAGGGQIHGNAEDFVQDKSGKIILSHTSSDYSIEQKEIGSDAHFGMMDILIPSKTDYLAQKAEQFLKSYFQKATKDQINVLLNNDIEAFNPGTIIIRRTVKNNYVFLILSGNVEIIISNQKVQNTVSSGALIGELSSLLGENSRFTYRAKSFVKVLKIPATVYKDFVKKNNYLKYIRTHNEKMVFIITNWLLGESVSYPVQNKLANLMDLVLYKPGSRLNADLKGKIGFIKSGIVHIVHHEKELEILKENDFFGEECINLAEYCEYHFEAITDCEIFFIYYDHLIEIPIIRWKILETQKRRERMLISPELNYLPLFSWKSEYSVSVRLFDEHHRQIVEKINDLYTVFSRNDNNQRVASALSYLMSYTRFHFTEEENLLNSYHYPSVEVHISEHRQILRKMEYFKKIIDSGEKPDNTEFVSFLKNWLVDHILTNDRNYGVFFNEKGVI